MSTEKRRDEAPSPLERERLRVRDRRHLVLAPTPLRRVHKRQKLARGCGLSIVTAPPPPKLVMRGQYSFGFAALLIVRQEGRLPGRPDCESATWRDGEL